MLKNYKELKCWEKAYQLCLEVYKITKGFPREERYGLTSQIRRAAVSVPSNIAEGYGRKTTTRSDGLCTFLRFGVSPAAPHRLRWGRLWRRSRAPAES